MMIRTKKDAERALFRYRDALKNLLFAYEQSGAHAQRPHDARGCAACRARSLLGHPPKEARPC